MKKKILLAFVLLLPIICNAKEEIKYRWYNFTEDNVKYVNKAECDCEYLDENDIKYTDYMYSLKEPKRKEGREITSDYKDYSFLRKYVNKLGITKFTGGNQYDFYELEVLDKDGSSLDYRLMNYSDNQYFLNDKKFDNTARVLTFVSLFLEFDKPIDIENTSIKVTYKNIMGEMNGIDFRTYMSDDYITNYFAGYSTINTSVCDDDKCEFTARIDKRQMSTTDVKINTKVYKYRDTLYKCYNKTKNYAPGYYEFLDGYIKDENEFIKTNVMTNEEVDSIIKENIQEVNTQNKKLIDEITKLKSNVASKNELDNILESIENNQKENKDKEEILKKIKKLDESLNQNKINSEELTNKITSLLHQNNIDKDEIESILKQIKSNIKESTSESNSEVKENNYTKDNLVSKEIDSNKIAMVTKEDVKVVTKSNAFILILGLSSLVVSILIFIKNAIKCRKK